ncbi:hypothetical protein DB347_23450 [Opitutaceae bacterium EW11]|nr:hypothetical protein DB347_23450 [Opitutaceae bacterium EW11]
MKGIRFFAAWAALFGFAVAWNGVVHLVVLADQNAAIAHLRRNGGAKTLALSLLLTAAVCAVFVFGYARATKSGSIREGVAFGGYFAVFAGLLVDFNQYLLYPLPGKLVVAWFLSGLAEFCLYGAIAAVVLRPLKRAPSPER